MKLKTKYSIVLLAAFVITAVLSAMLASLLKAPGTAKIVIDQQAFFFFALGIGAIVIILLALMAQYWLDQLNDIANALYDCSKGKLTTLPIKSDDELGDVCRAFNEASANIGRGNVYQTSRSKVLQAKIDKKTQDQTRQLKELEAMRAATLNMLEDLDQAYGDLKEEVREKDELFNITSHELKSPLVPIVGYIDLLQHKKIPGELSKEQVEALDVIYKNAIRLSNLIEDVLDIARLQARKMKFNFKKDSLSSVQGSASENETVQQQYGIPSGHFQKVVSNQASTIEEARSQNLLFPYQ
ncbi:MAG: histidine kinase dimerization/phospho-acceptor domain-containing protein [Candidatus Nanoarchaeia archaeon]